jgi:hypothetical protein
MIPYVPNSPPTLKAIIYICKNLIKKYKRNHKRTDLKLINMNPLLSYPIPTQSILGIFLTKIKTVGIFAWKYSSCISKIVSSRRVS